MTKKIIAMSAFLMAGFCANAQTWVEDSVSLGAGYAKDIYYSLSNGSQRVEGNKNWHLGFSLAIADSASVWANHNGGTSFVKVYNTNKNYSQWSTIALGDTATSVLTFNNDQGWYQGAFNDVPSANAFDFGWGVYDPSTHIITGDRIFVVKADGNFYKVCIKQYDAIGNKWKFDVATLTASGAGTTVTDSISKQPNYASNLFAYYNLATLADTNREPSINAWDLQFMRYTTNDPLSGSQSNNTVVGVLHNRGVQTVRVSALDVDTTYKNYASYKTSLSPVISTIGYNWKTFDLANNTWDIEPENSYIIKDKIGNLWQLEFINFGGSANGNVYFRKRMVEPLKINDFNSALRQYNVYPNPTSNELNLILDTKQQTNASIRISDMTGKLLVNQSVSLIKGLNAFKLPISNMTNGNYILSIRGEAVDASQQFTINR